jgi:hypothetical protein
MAFQTMIDSGLSKKKRQDKGLIDEISATIMLQDYLNRKPFNLIVNPFGSVELTLQFLTFNNKLLYFFTDIVSLRLKFCYA